jgi:aspartate/glutamate racemase
LTPVLQSVLAPLELEAPVLRFFEHYEAAVEAMADYQAALCADAARRRSIGLTVTDQDQPDEAFCLFPARPTHPPLAIVGGMGPLAGALAFRQTCARFQDSRAVVLYQACSVPDRSPVILGEAHTDTVLCREMASRLADAVRLAVGLAHASSQQVRCVIACNSAHYFWRLVAENLRQSRTRVQMISLVDSSVEALRFERCRRALLLATEGARAGEVFSTPCREAGIAFDEPSPTLSRLLMSAVYEGIKSLDERRAVELGNEFFDAVERSGRDYDCILAGCTELPLTIDLLRLHGSPAVAAFLARVKIVDPLEAALAHA